MGRSMSWPERVACGNGSQWSLDVSGMDMVVLMYTDSRRREM